MRAKAINDSKLKTIKKLYYEELLSVPEISKRIGISVWSAYYFFRAHNLPRRTYQEERAIRFARKPLSYSKVDLDTPELRELALVGSMLYWGEGYKGSKEKPSHTVDFANSDPSMIMIFLKFLRKIYFVDESRLRIQLYCYSDQDVEHIIEFWSSLTLISRDRFTKPFVRSDFNDKARKMRYGLAHIRYSDKKLLLDIKSMIDSYVRKHCADGGVV